VQALTSIDRRIIVGDYQTLIKRLDTGYLSFGCRLFQELAKEHSGENILVSPFCIIQAIAVAYNGSDGETREAIARLLGVDGHGLDEFNQHNGATLKMLKARTGVETQIEIVNALWADSGVEFAPDYLQQIAEYYWARARGVAFSDAATLTAINRQISLETNGKIANLLSSQDVGERAGCILTSSIYFKGKWAKPFDRARTRQGSFTLLNGRSKQVHLMTTSSEFAYLATESLQVIELPFVDGRLDFFVFLPAKTSNIGELLSRLRADKLDEWLSLVKPEQVELSLPRFGIRYEAELKSSLTKLGLGIAFTAQADFGLMGPQGLYIRQIKHQAVAEINEEGAEAAASTAVMMGRSLRKPRRMIVDRPFLWAIRDRETGAVLFLGLIVEPAGLESKTSEL
jgi:serine protease inhibitor